jgi:pilus assembly protein CpaC
MRLSRLAWLAGPVIGLAVAMTAGAAERHPSRDARHASGAVDVRPTGTIALAAGQGTLIRLARPATTVFVANPDIADVQVKSPALVYVSAKTPGQTVIYAVDKDDRVLLSKAIKVEYDLTQLRQSFASLLPGNRITAATIEGKLVLSGVAATAADAQKACALALAITGKKAEGKGAATAPPRAASSGGGGAAGGGASQAPAAVACSPGGESAMQGNVLNQIVVATPNQVNLRVRIAEVKKDVLKQLGINWNAHSGTLQFTTSNPTTGPADIIGGATGATGATAGAAAAVQNSLSLTHPGLQAELDALSQEGLATTLAEPNLTAVSGQTASFLVGGTIEIPTSITNAAAGAPTIAVGPQSFGVRLDFTPTILGDNRISLKLRPEVSALNYNDSTTIQGSVLPGKDVTVAETTVELASGQSFALAGLLQNNTTENLSKIPGIGDIPILGALFRSVQFQHNETELVIIVTPYLVRPVATALQTPVDGFTAPHDNEQILNADTYRQKLPAPERGPLGPGGSGLIGPVGFRLD